MSMTPTEFFNQCPPNLCRVLAIRKGGFPMTNMEISRLSGLCERTIRTISKKRTWTDIPLWQMEAFSAACGIDIMRPKTSAYRKFRRSKLAIRRMTPRQRMQAGRLFG